MSKNRAKTPRSSTEIRELMLRYFYDRNQNATSARGKQGFAIKIMDIRKELKELHGLTVQEVTGNLNYLLSEGWIEEDAVEKSVPLKSGTVIPQSTSYYKITAPGIDKIEGPGEFTMDKFKGIRIEATGQNIITVGDGNKVDAKYQEAAGALVELKETIRSLESLTESQKVELIADIDSIQSQLAKSEPNKAVVSTAWESIRKYDTVLGIAEKTLKVGALLAPFLS